MKLTVTTYIVTSSRVFRARMFESPIILFAAHLSVSLARDSSVRYDLVRRFAPSLSRGDNNDDNRDGAAYRAGN